MPPGLVSRMESGPGLLGLRARYSFDRSANGKTLATPFVIKDYGPASAFDFGPFLSSYSSLKFAVGSLPFDRDGNACWDGDD